MPSSTPHVWQISHRCPHCGKLNDSASNIDGTDQHPPSVGSLSFCLCGEWGVWETSERLRKPTDDELIEIGLDPACRAIRAAWVRMRIEESIHEKADQEAS